MIETRGGGGADRISPSLILLKNNGVEIAKAYLSSIEGLSNITQLFPKTLHIQPIYRTINQCLHPGYTPQIRENQSINIGLINGNRFPLNERIVKLLEGRVKIEALQSNGHYASTSFNE